MKNFTLALCLAVGSVAASSIPTPLIAQTQAQTPDTIAQTFFARVKAGNYNIAVTNFFGPESPAATKKSEMALVASQIESAVDAPMNCCTCRFRFTS